MLSQLFISNDIQCSRISDAIANIYDHLGNEEAMSLTRSLQRVAWDSNFISNNQRLMNYSTTFCSNLDKLIMTIL